MAPWLGLAQVFKSWGKKLILTGSLGIENFALEALNQARYELASNPLEIIRSLNDAWSASSRIKKPIPARPVNNPGGLMTVPLFKVRGAIFLPFSIDLSHLLFNSHARSVSFLSFIALPEAAIDMAIPGIPQQI